MTAHAAIPESRTSKVLKAIGILPFVLVLTCVLLALYEPRFLRVSNLINVLRNASFLTIISAGQMLVIIVGGFDISVGAIVALTSVSSALSMVGLSSMGIESAGVIVLLGCLMGLVPALAVGIANGFLVSVLKISPFMVTIGTMTIAVGIAGYVTGGTPIYDMPELFTREIGRGKFLRLPYIVYAAALVLALLWFMQNQTRLGRYFYAVGGNEKASRLTGLNTRKYIWLAYVLSALLAGIVGLFLTARVGSGEATLGSNLMLESISVAVIGGVALKGGVGRIQMVALSAIFLAVLSNGMSLARIDSKYHIIIIGLVIVFAVAAESFRESRRNKHV
ncbi:ABC transporter permease [Aliiroseovarius subalbicans]|uniref:ABC transporter permease n=1 Tax=Aliiroseovarius subalbicans TaxID=2925840 RepID=UPI001F57923E|nr:ABC transporter permease [Aliiroseovarius subalbicans]MCI2400944.1 ABC transporter permease [Aliiroseovarius subalbicans]